MNFILSKVFTIFFSCWFDYVCFDLCYSLLSSSSLSKRLALNVDRSSITKIIKKTVNNLSIPINILSIDLSIHLG